MLQALPNPLSQSERESLRKYLNQQPESETLRAVIVAHVAALEVEAANALVSSIEEHSGHGLTATENATEAVRWRHALSVLQELREQDDSLFRVALAVDNPVITPADANDN